MTKPAPVSFQYPTSNEAMPTGPWAAAGVLVDVNAGWRVERPVIDAAKCTKCMKCWLVCPDGAVDRSGGAYSIDLAYCKGCGLCAHECRPGAIAMVREGEGERV